MSTRGHLGGGGSRILGGGGGTVTQCEAPSDDNRLKGRDCVLGIAES